jgi:hypothetical protein
MLKVNFEKVNSRPYTKMNLYSNINPIPFSLSIGKYDLMPSIIYSRNLYGENFIEFRFDKENRNLYEISLVAIQDDAVMNKSSDKEVKTDEFYICNIIEEESTLEDVVPMGIERNKNSISINLLSNKSSEIKYFAIGDNCFIGISADSYIASVFLNELNEENIKQIIGF